MIDVTNGSARKASTKVEGMGKSRRVSNRTYKNGDQYMAGTELQTDFDVFWRAYPRRVGKKDAQAAWKRLKPNADTVQAILAALEWQAQSKDWQKDDGIYIPYPATYLRGERWTDERPQMLREDRLDRLSGLRDFVNG
jgi:hypothetical protein